MISNIPNQDMTLKHNQQAALFPGVPDYEVPRSSLLKWIGNKLRSAPVIARHAPNKFGRYIEPFVGSGAVLGTLAPIGAIAADVHAPLIKIWLAVRDDPQQVSHWYRERWTRYTDGDADAVYGNIRDDYNSKPNPADLLFLCRSCYGGVVRFRKSDGSMSTPRGPHKPIRPETFDKRLEDWSRRVRSTRFELQGYRDTLRAAAPGDFVYCDPPYVDTQRILYGAQDFSFEELVLEISACKKRGVFVALSIDGAKRSGKDSIALTFPEGLFEREVAISLGASMLKRFQSRGRVLHDHHVSDRLLLTYPG